MEQSQGRGLEKAAYRHHVRAVSLRFTARRRNYLGICLAPGFAALNLGFLMYVPFWDLENIY